MTNKTSVITEEKEALLKKSTQLAASILRNSFDDSIVHSLGKINEPKKTENKYLENLYKDAESEEEKKVRVLKFMKQEYFFIENYMDLFLKMEKSSLKNHYIKETDNLSKSFCNLPMEMMKSLTNDDALLNKYAKNEDELLKSSKGLKSRILKKSVPVMDFIQNLKTEKKLLLTIKEVEKKRSLNLFLLSAAAVMIGIFGGFIGLVFALIAGISLHLKFNQKNDYDKKSKELYDEVMSLNSDYQKGLCLYLRDESNTDDSAVNFVNDVIEKEFEVYFYSFLLELSEKRDVEDIHQDLLSFRDKMDFEYI